MHLVGAVDEAPDERVTHLVVRDHLALLLGEEPRLLLGAGDHAHDPFLELLLADHLVTAARGEQRGLVDHVGEVGAREAGSPGREHVEIDLLVERLALRVDVEDLLPALAVGPVDDDLPVEATRAEQSRVEDVRPVRGGDQDDVVLQLEAVHLDEELVERLLALVVTAAEPGAAVAADGVDLVDEDDAGARLLRLLEQVADAGRADADEHLDEVGARDREERDARLAGGRPREEGLTGAGRAVEEHTLRDAGPERLELLRVLEELLDLLKLLDRLVGARDVLVRDLRRVGRHALGAALAEAHHLRAAALHLVHQEEPEPEQEHDRQQRGEQRPPGRRADALRVEDRARALVLEDLLQLELRLIRRVVDLHLLPVGERRLDLLPVRVEDGASRRFPPSPPTISCENVYLVLRRVA